MICSSALTARSHMLSSSPRSFNPPTLTAERMQSAISPWSSCMSCMGVVYLPETPETRNTDSLIVSARSTGDVTTSRGVRRHLHFLFVIVSSRIRPRTTRARPGSDSLGHTGARAQVVTSAVSREAACSRTAPILSTLREWRDDPWRINNEGGTSIPPRFTGISLSPRPC